MAPTSGFDMFSVNKRSPQPNPAPATTRTSPPTRASLTIEGGLLEAWAQGYNTGSLVILILIVFCNYRSGILLHKLILLELILAIWHGTFIFVEDPAYGWYLSATATLLFISYFLHNVVAWLKIKPFLPRWGSRLFIITLVCVQPFWVAEAWSNFAYFNSLGSEANIRMRPWEALLRDPWWIFTTWKLVNAIKKTYGYNLCALVKINSRFGVMLLCMALSIAFLLTDAAISAAKVTASSGINPYWRFALVFKCASDTIFLDDFKSVLDDIVARKFSATDATAPGRSNTPSRTHKLSQSASRGHEFMECISLENPDGRPVYASSSASTRTTKSQCLSPFSQKKKQSTPKMHVQNETTVSSQGKAPSQESSGSDTATITRPANTVYGSGNAISNDSDRSLFNGRMI